MELWQNLYQPYTLILIVVCNMKKQVKVNLSMDKEVIEKAKELGINPSKFCENALGKNLSKFCENALKEAIEKMQNQKP